MDTKTVVIHGASGRVGQVLLNTLCQEPRVKLVGAVDIKAPGDKIILGDGSTIPFSTDLEKILIQTSPQVMVDFSVAKASMPAVRTAVKHHVNVVIGTTGLTAGDIAEIENISQASGVGVIMASNLALGAVLMMHFAKIAAKYMDYAEITEQHHQTKIDAPSGTAINTARAMAASRGKPFSQAVDFDKNYPSRGQVIDGVHIHSVRIAGLMAHQEVMLGGLGQTLTIRHDTINRECYTPGVLLAIQEVDKYKGLVQGLDKIMNLQ